MAETERSAAMLLPVHGLTPHLRVRITTDDRSLTVERRHAVLGFIPLPRSRIVVPLRELSSARIGTNVRLDSLVGAGALVAAIVLLHLPIAAVVPLAIVGLYLLLLSFPMKALWIERTDGRSWRVPFCRRYAFDASLALLDAERRRDAGVRTAGPVEVQPGPRD